MIAFVCNSASVRASAFVCARTRVFIPRHCQIRHKSSLSANDSLLHLYINIYTRRRLIVLSLLVRETRLDKRKRFVVYMEQKQCTRWLGRGNRIGLGRKADYGRWILPLPHFVINLETPRDGWPPAEIDSRARSRTVILGDRIRMQALGQCAVRYILRDVPVTAPAVPVSVARQIGEKMQNHL